MKCRRGPNGVLIEICEPVLGNWPQSVLGKQGCSPLGPGTIKEHKPSGRSFLQAVQAPAPGLAAARAPLVAFAAWAARLSRPLVRSFRSRSVDEAPGRSLRVAR